LRQRFRSRAARLQQQLLCKHSGVHETMQQVHALLSAHLSDGAVASHSSVLLNSPEYVSSSSSSSSGSSCSGTSALQEAAAAAAAPDPLQSVQQESQQLPGTCRSLKDVTVAAAAAAAPAAEPSKGTQADTVTATAAVAVASAGTPAAAIMAAGDAAAKATETDAVEHAPGASFAFQKAVAGVEQSVEAAWTKSAANGRWQLKLQHSSRQRSSTQLMPHSAAASGTQQLPNLQDAFDAAASTAIGSMVLARAASRAAAGVTKSSSSKGSSSTLQAGLGAANSARLEAARGKLLELLCSAVHTEVRPLTA
jgi:hypothetical protein